MLRIIAQTEGEMKTEYTIEDFSRLIHSVLINNSTICKRPSQSIKLTPRQSFNSGGLDTSENSDIPIL